MLKQRMGRWGLAGEQDVVERRRQGIGKPRNVSDNHTYRVEFREPYVGRWKLFTTKIGTKPGKEVPGVWERGENGGFVYGDQARTAAKFRSKRHPENLYRVTMPTTGQVTAIYKAGERVHQEEAPDMSGGATEGDTLSTKYRAEFYQSSESLKRSGPGTGVNAPTPDPGKWWRGGPTSSLEEAERVYANWTQSKGVSSYKRARVVMLHRDGHIEVIRDSAGDMSYEQGDGRMHADTNPVREPLTIPRGSIIDKLSAAQADLKAKHDKAQADLAEANKSKLNKVEKIDPWLVLKMFENIFGPLKDDDDSDKVQKRASDHFGREPGTVEYVNDKRIEKLLSVLNIATDETLKVLPGDDVYSYL